VKIRYPEEWTDKEWSEFEEEFEEEFEDLYGHFTGCEMSTIARKAISIATSPPPRREIEPGTLVHVGYLTKQWADNGALVEFYFRRDDNGEHLCNQASWKYARPVKPGWKPGDELTPPNEGDL
jgi:hypothetical protein